MKLNLKLKLLFLVSLAIFIPISVSSYLYYNSLMVEYKRDAYISTTNDYKIIDSEIKDLADNLKNLSNQIKDDKNIQSILNLISNYEDRDNYSKIIFDEEKKKLLYIVSQQLKSKQNISFGIFDKNGDAIVLNRIKDGNRVNGFISYNGKANFIDIKTGTILKMPFYRKATLDSTDKLHILLDKYGFALVYLQKIYIDGKFIGFIKIKELFTQSNIDQFIQNLHNKFSFLSRDLMVGDFFDVDKQFIFKNGSIHTDKHTISEMAENLKYSFHIHYIDTILNDEKLYLISAYDKKLLTSKINSLRDNLFLSILISIILSFFISMLFLQKTILNPIAKLIDGINNLKNKNYKLIELKSDDEFSVIANQFNRLTNTLKDSFNKIENTNHHLEESVKFQNKLLALFDTKNTALFIWNYDKDWSVDYTTDHIVNILGYTKDQFLRKDILYLDIIHKDDLALVNQEVDDAIKNNLNYFRHEPYRIITKDGDEKWILDQTMITKDDNKIINFIGFITDITDSKMKALQLAKSEKMASMGEMIGNIAHQWRQPIAIISMWANNIIADVDIDDIDNENLIKYSNNIQEQTKYLSQTIEDFRDFIKGDRVKTRFNLDDGVKSFLNLVEGSIKTHNIDIILDLQKDIVIEGYKNELNQCLINIFKNAKDILKVNIKDEKLIFISTSREGKDIVIKIKDNGGGIPEKILPKIFEPYFTTKHKSQGTGLGLNMTYNLIVKGMGGTIRVDNVTYEYNNKKFTGAEFTITLPIN